MDLATERSFSGCAGLVEGWGHSLGVKLDGSDADGKLSTELAALDCLIPALELRADRVADAEELDAQAARVA